MNIKYSKNTFKIAYYRQIMTFNRQNLFFYDWDKNLLRTYCQPSLYPNMKNSKRERCKI